MTSIELGPKDKHFRQLDEPIAKVREAAIKAVEDLPESATRAFLLGVLASISDTYRAVCLLNSDSVAEHFSADCDALVRTMLESYFALLFWRQEPEERSMWYWKSAWRDDAAEMQLDEQLARYDPAIQERIDMRRQTRAGLLRLLNLSQAEICGAVRIRPWPCTPGKMIRLAAKWRDEATRLQAQRLYDLMYPSQSRRAHPSWIGLGSRYAYREAKKLKDKPELIQRSLRMSRTRVVFEALLVTVMVVTELDHQQGLGMAESLRAAWRTLLEFRPHAQAYYEARFESLLGAL